MKKLPVIDIFAGPGGLGEGFAQAGFDIRLSIEMDKTASETLKIRKFFYQFKKGMAPEEYYKFLQCKIDKEELKEAFPKEWELAEGCVFNAELGKEDQTIIIQRIKESLRVGSQEISRKSTTYKTIKHAREFYQNNKLKTFTHDK